MSTEIEVHFTYTGSISIDIGTLRENADDVEGFLEYMILGTSVDPSDGGLEWVNLDEAEEAAKS
jgi:hypothetical protein